MSSDDDEPPPAAGFVSISIAALPCGWYYSGTGNGCPTMEIRWKKKRQPLIAFACFSTGGAGKPVAYGVWCVAPSLIPYKPHSLRVSLCMMWLT